MTLPATDMPMVFPWAVTSLPLADGEAPSLLIAALRDPDGANLDRIQVVKGWTNDDGSAGGAGL